MLNLVTALYDILIKLAEAFDRRKETVIVGAQSSGTDIARELSAVADVHFLYPHDVSQYPEQSFLIVFFEFVRNLAPNLDGKYCQGPN